jgi:hypothetical protein
MANAESRAKEFFHWQLSNYEKMDIVTGEICLGIFEKETDNIVGQIAAKATLEWIERNYDIPYVI